MNNWNWQIRNKSFLEKSIKRCREKKIILPTFKQLKDPSLIPSKIQKQLESVDLNDIHPARSETSITWKSLKQSRVLKQG
jgi:hypothetical protein